MKLPWLSLFKAVGFMLLAKISLPLMIIPGLEEWGTDIYLHLNARLKEEISKIESSLRH